jgi:integrase
MQRYADEVTPGKRGRRWEEIRLKIFHSDPEFPVGNIGELTPDHLGRWRDARARSVSAGTIIRELGLVSAILEHARREWRLIEVNPARDVRKPRAPEHRQVLITRPQIKAFLRAMGYRPSGPVRAVSQSVAVAFLLALRTGMRAGELCGLTWDRVFADYCRLPVTKTVPRDVPLTGKAQRLMGKMRGYDPTFVLGLKTASLDAHFRKFRARAGIEGVTFHDSRHTAATWLAQRIHALDLCRAFGWSNVNQAMTYYNASASDIAQRLTPKRGQSR